jgi:prepilin-type N-terminal cleavage/methylation domain-containing protein
MKRTYRILAGHAGFTLPELMLGIAIAGFIMAGLFTIQRQGQAAYLMGSSRVETQQNARVALELMTRELRTASQITSLASATNLTFVWKDAADAPHTIQYTLSGATLNRTFDGTTTALIGGVQELGFTYYSIYDVSTGTYTTTSSTAAVKVIKIAIKTKTEENVAANSAGDEHAVMESTVMLRLALS